MIMVKFIEILNLLDRLHNLIQRKATGAPKELACKLGLSVRQVHKLIALMRSFGAPINYCSLRHTYYYEAEIEFNRNLFVEKDKTL